MSTGIKICILLCLFSQLCFSQKKKTIKKLGIKTAITTDLVNGKILNDSKTTFNEDGKVTEEVKYDPDGTLKSTVRYKYDGQQNVVMETEFDHKNVIVEIRKTKYMAGKKTEELFLSRDNRQLKKFTYTYNLKGLKTERKTYDAANKLISVKKYTYQFNK